jgi:hypothetical protein
LGDVKKIDELFFRLARSAFCDIAGDTDCGSANLIG